MIQEFDVFAPAFSVHVLLSTASDPEAGSQYC